MMKIFGKFYFNFKQSIQNYFRKMRWLTPTHIPCDQLIRIGCQWESVMREMFGYHFIQNEISIELESQ